MFLLLFVICSGKNKFYFLVFNFFLSQKLKNWRKLVLNLEFDGEMNKLQINENSMKLVKIVEKLGLKCQK